jgi:hypothetical protein
MPTRKQRRRRQKDRRHEWEYVYVDGEGQEVEVDEADERPVKATKETAKAPSKKTGKTSRPVREPPVPSWNRSFKRALPWQVLLMLALLLVLKSGPLISRISVGLFYAIMLVPFMYWTDKLARQRYLKQTGQLPPKQKPGSKKS